MSKYEEALKKFDKDMDAIPQAVVKEARQCGVLAGEPTREQLKLITVSVAVTGEKVIDAMQPVLEAGIDEVPL